MKRNLPEDLYLMLGFNKGQLIIYDVLRFDTFLARYEVTRHKIEMIREVLAH